MGTNQQRLYLYLGDEHLRNGRFAWPFAAITLGNGNSTCFNISEFPRKEPFGAMSIHFPCIFPMKLGAVWSYSEVPDQMIAHQNWRFSMAMCTAKLGWMAEMLLGIDNKKRCSRGKWCYNQCKWWVRSGECCLHESLHPGNQQKKHHGRGQFPNGLR